MRDFYYVDTGGILSCPDGRAMTPKEAADKINRLIKENTRHKDRLQIGPDGSDKIDELWFANDLLHQRAEIAEHERDELRKELEECRRAHSQPIGGPSEE